MLLLAGPALVVAEAQVVPGRMAPQLRWPRTHTVPAVQGYGLRLPELLSAVRAVAEVGT